MASRRPRDGGVRPKAAGNVGTRRRADTDSVHGACRLRPVVNFYSLSSDMGYHLPMAVKNRRIAHAGPVGDTGACTAELRRAHGSTPRNPLPDGRTAKQADDHTLLEFGGAQQ